MCKQEERDRRQNGVFWAQHDQWKTRVGWCVGPTITIALLQRLGSPSLMCSCTTKKIKFN